MISLLCISPGMSKEAFLIFERNAIIGLSSIILFIVFLKKSLLLNKKLKNK
ncbi:MAG: hypothetical protein HPAVJP_0790 [Candidatus Hepatoplasma vulgare]|nr:MAG: hypothetical protein HPAVJP_0790 [Candidatus Hepatoplasma sp.]